MKKIRKQGRSKEEEDERRNKTVKGGIGGGRREAHVKWKEEGKKNEE